MRTKLSWPIAVWLLLAGTFLGILAERASTPVLSRDAFVSLLAQCGSTGKPVEEAVRAIGLTERAWGRTVSLHAADPRTAAELESRLALVR